MREQLPVCQIVGGQRALSEKQQTPFKDRDDVKARLCAELGDKGKKLWHAMVSTAGISIRCE